MAKLILTVPAILFVLISGLVSCRQEHKNITKNIYSPGSPRIRRGNTVNGESKSGIDYTDQFRFQEPRPVKVHVQSHCLRGIEPIEFEYILSDPRGLDGVGVHELLPADQLLRDLNADNLICDFKFELFNSIGSSFITRIPTVPVREAGPWPVTITGPSLDSETLLSVTRFHLYKIRYSSHALVNASLECQDISFPALPFDRATGLDQIDLMVTAANSAGLQRRPIQTCRILMAEGTRTVGFSAIFKVLFNPAPLYLIEANLSYDPFTEFNRAINRIERAPTPTVAQFQMLNDSPYERRLRVPRKTLNIEATLYLSGHTFQHSGNGRDRVTRPFGEVILAGAQVERVDTEFTLVRLPPGSILTISVRPHKGEFRCGGTRFSGNGVGNDFTLNLLGLRLVDSLVVTEIDGQTQPIGTYDLPRSRGILLKAQPSTDMDTNRYGSFDVGCQWTD